MAKPVKSGSKKPYSSPELTVYGTVRELTQSHNTIGNRDNPRAATYTRLH
jgi:hypothetical protein